MGDRLAVIPLTLPNANECVSRWHRHHGPIGAGFVWFCLGAVSGTEIVAAAICGRPTNRNNDDGQTIELIRLSSNGHPNACSFLYGAAARAARMMGASRIITYTLEAESGSSLRAAGWNRDKDGIQSRWMHNGTRRTAIYRPHMEQLKVRWSVNFRPPVDVNIPERTNTDAIAGQLTIG